MTAYDRNNSIVCSRCRQAHQYLVPMKTEAKYYRDGVQWTTQVEDTICPPCLKKLMDGEPA